MLLQQSTQQGQQAQQPPQKLVPQKTELSQPPQTLSQPPQKPGELPALHLTQRDQNVAGKQGPEGPADAATRLRAAPRHPTGHGAL